MGFLSKLKKTLNPKNVLNPVKAVSTAWDNTKSIVAQDSRNIRGLAGALGGDQNGSGLMSKLYREADKNVQDPKRAMIRAAITAAAIYTGGAAWSAYAGAGAGAGAGAAATGAGAGGLGGAVGTGAVGAGTAATGAGLSGISGTIASALGPEVAAAWGGMSAVQQAAVLGALQGGVQGGLSGGGWEGVLKGAAMGGFTGGVGAYAGPALSSATGMAPWASRAAVSAGLGGLGAGINGGNVWQGALGAGLGSLATTGLGSMGVPSGLSGYLGGMAGRVGAGAIAGGSGGSSGGGANGQPAGFGGLSGGDQGVGSQNSLNGSLLGNPQLGSASAQQNAWLQSSYAPIAQEEQRRRALRTFKENPEFGEELAEA